MLIKYLLIAVVILIIGRITGQFRRGGIAVREYLLWLVLWLGGIVVILRPETATFMANLVGVGRGADFMVYISIILLFYIVFRALVRQERMEKDITKVVREIALRQAPSTMHQADNPPLKQENMSAKGGST